jgi:hypothetical protein
MERIKYQMVGENTKKMQKFINIYIIFGKKKKKPFKFDQLYGAKSIQLSK